MKPYNFSGLECFYIFLFSTTHLSIDLGVENEKMSQLGSFQDTQYSSQDTGTSLKVRDFPGKPGTCNKPHMKGRNNALKI